MALTPAQVKARKKSRTGTTPPPPPSLAERRIDSGLSWGGRLWSGIESIPAGVKKQEEDFRHAISSDARTHRGLVGAATYPWELYLGTALALGGGKKDRERLKKIAKAPLSQRGKRSALDVVGEPFIRESYKTTKQATGGYGPKKAAEIWSENPVAAIGGAAVLVAPAARLAGIGRLAKTFAEANPELTAAQAQKAALVESYHPGSMAAQGIKGSPFVPRLSGRKVSRNPIGRAGQRAFDTASEKIDAGIGSGKFGVQTGPGTILSATRRRSAGERRAADLSRDRMVTDAMQHVKTYADYINHGIVQRVKRGTPFVRDKAVMDSRDAAVGAALHASGDVDPVEAVLHVADDTAAQIESGRRIAHNGDISDLAPEQRVGQRVFLYHGADENGNPIQEEATVTADHGDGTVTLETPEGEATVKESRARLQGGDGTNTIPLSELETEMLRKREADLRRSYGELNSDPEAKRKFVDAVNEMTVLGTKNEALALDFYGRGLAPGSARWAELQNALDERRNQFIDRSGGQTVVDFSHPDWQQLWDAMESAPGISREEALAFQNFMAREAYLWAREVEGRNPSDYLTSPEGADLAGIAFSSPEDLQATANALFQKAGVRNHLVSHSTSVLVDAEPNIGNYVSTPYGPGVLEYIEPQGSASATVRVRIGDESYWNGRLDELKVVNAQPEYPFVGVMVETPDGFGTVTELRQSTSGTDYIEVDLSGGGSYAGPRDAVRVVAASPDVGIWHLASEKALTDPKFPQKATAAQYRKALEKAGVKPDEFYWLGLDDFFGGVGEKSFPVAELERAISSGSLFLDIKEALYSSNARDSSWGDKWGPGRGSNDGGEGSGLIIRDPTNGEPYHELVLSLRNSDLYTGGHFPQTGGSQTVDSPLIHIRFHEITDNEGKQAILIDEIQSDWNGAGRRSGWKPILTPADRRRVEELRAKESQVATARSSAAHLMGTTTHALDNWVDSKVHDLAQTFNVARKKWMDETGGNYKELPEDWGGDRIYYPGTSASDTKILREKLRERMVAEGDEVGVHLFDAQQKLFRLGQRELRYRNAADAIERPSGQYNAVNQGPLVMGDAPKLLAMKRLIRWAADHGQERIIWTRGHEQGVRYGKYDDLPTRPDHSDMEPDEEFYYMTGNGSAVGGNAINPRLLQGPVQHELSRQDLPPGEMVGSNNYGIFGDQSGGTKGISMYEMQLNNSRPVIVEWADMADSGDKYVLLPEDHLNPNSHRHARILADHGDQGEVQPLPPQWDPSRVEMSYHGSTGSGGENSWVVKIYNRLGKQIYHGTPEGGGYEPDKGDFLRMVKNDWEGQMNNDNAPLGDRDLADETLAVLDDMEWFGDEFDSMVRGADSHLDEYAWEDYLNYSERGGREGDFQEIRDYKDYGQNRVDRVKEEIKSIESRKQYGIEQGQINLDIYDEQLAQAKEALKQAEENLNNKAHRTGYDKVMPSLAEKMLRPYRKEGDYTPVGLKEEIYRGRYGSEESGVITEEGDIHGWSMDLPKRMLRDAKDSQPLFQRGNDIVKGASVWVDGKSGRRFVALTEEADFSTLMHEFIGHATDEMARRYPDLWEAVEESYGKKLSDWTVADHEKFAKQVERYFREGKIPDTPELVPMMKVIKEWMKAVYQSILELGKPIPASTRMLLDRHLGAGISARPGARAYVPHTSLFDTTDQTYGGAVRLPAGGSTIGVPQSGGAFSRKGNRSVLWESGEVALSARPIVSQFFRRQKFIETEAVRAELYAQAHPLGKRERVPKDAWLIRDPSSSPDRFTALTKGSQKMSEEDFSRLIGDTENADQFNTKMESLRKDMFAEPGERPDWADYESTRWIEGAKVKARIENVFPSAPRGRTASGVGAANTLARMAGIYLRPIHYLVGNIPQNVIMVGLTNPSALLNSAKYGAYAFLPRVIREMGKGPADLFAHDRHLYDRIKTETGDIQAGAGLPDFYTMANNNFQKTERRLNQTSAAVAERLGELADQPYRVSIWIAHAKKYGYSTPDEWRALLDAEPGTPEARIRDGIAQSSREDMIDFNTISPGERQNVSRFFYLWAFTRGFAKWPITFAREYPGRTGLIAMQSDSQARDDNGFLFGAIPSNSVLRSNSKTPGKIRDLTFLDPSGGLRQQIETGIQVAHGNLSGIGGMLTPPLETVTQAATGGPRAPKGGLGALGGQLARDIIPGVDLTLKALTPGLSGLERVDRVIEVTGRFDQKDELGRGKNAERKRNDEKKANATLDKAEVFDPGVRETVQRSLDAYWHRKYLEQQIRFGAQAQRKGTSLTQKEKLGVMYATALRYYPGYDLPPIEEIIAGGPEVQKAWTDDLSEAMFAPYNEVTK